MADGSPRSSAAEYAVLDHIPLGVAVLNSQLRVVFWNASLEEWTEVPREQMLGEDIRDRFPHLGEARFAKRLESLFSGGPPALFSSQLHPHLFPAPRRSGRMRTLKTLAVPVPAGSDGFDVLIAAQDVSDLSDAMVALRSAHGEAERQAGIDPLTGIANRRAFFDLARKAIAHARRHARPCTLLMIDVDGFKGVNDRLGHAAGDAVLRVLVEIFARSLRESDVVARIGGDEFVVLLLEAERETALQTAERLRADVAHEVVRYEQEEIRVGISIGLTGLDADVQDVDALLKRADTALYEAKRGGRNRIEAR